MDDVAVARHAIRALLDWHSFQVCGEAKNFGLMLAVAGILEVLLSLYRSAFITAYSWDKVAIIVPILLLAIGLILILYRPHREQEP